MIKKNRLTEETKSEILNIAENIWSAACIIQHMDNPVDKPLKDALFKHYDYLRELVGKK